MADLRRMRIGVLLGGMSEERPVSLMTGSAIATVLRSEGYDIVEIDVDENVSETIRKEKVEVAVVALHGRFGEDGTIQGLLELMGVPYTGSGVLGSALAMDKIVTKELLSFHGIPTADYFTLTRSSAAEKDPIPQGFDFPLVVKPAASGSSIGVTVVRNGEEFRTATALAGEYGEDILVEKFIEGKLVTAGMVGEESLPLIEIRPKGGMYDYEAKYTKGKTDYIVPAEVSPETEERCKRYAQRTRRVLRCDGVCRADAIVDAENRIFFLELNTIPGLTETSLIPKAAAQAGIPFSRLVERMLELAVGRK